MHVFYLFLDYVHAHKPALLNYHWSDQHAWNRSYVLPLDQSMLTIGQSYYILGQPECCGDENGLFCFF